MCLAKTCGWDFSVHVMLHRLHLNLCLPLLVVPNLITPVLQLQYGQFLLFMCYLLVLFSITRIARKRLALLWWLRAFFLWFYFNISNNTNCLFNRKTYSTILRSRTAHNEKHLVSLSQLTRWNEVFLMLYGAANQVWTGDLRLTMATLYQLSYSGITKMYFFSA